MTCSTALRIVPKHDVCGQLWSKLHLSEIPDVASHMACQLQLLVQSKAAHKCCVKGNNSAYRYHLPLAPFFYDHVFAQAPLLPPTMCMRRGLCPAATLWCTLGACCQHVQWLPGAAQLLASTAPLSAAAGVKLAYLQPLHV
jgi:hypothetical protein